MPHFSTPLRACARTLSLVKRLAWKRWLSAVLIPAALSACTKADAPVAIVPLDRGGVPPLLTVNIGERPYQLAFDTGTTFIVLDPHTASRHLKQLSDTEITSWGRYREPLARTATLLGGEQATIEYYRVPPLRYGRWALPFAAFVDGIQLPTLEALSRRAGSRVNGLLGITPISTLNWIWNPGVGRLEGYRFASKSFNTQRDNMTCTAISVQPDGLPAIALQIGGWTIWSILDTGFVGDASGSLSIADVAILRHLKALTGEVTAHGTTSAERKAGESLTAVQVKTAHLENLQFDDLVFHQIALSSARLGVSFINRFERVAFDFEKNRFCFVPPKHSVPDKLPTQAELAEYKVDR